ncbi:O-antigen ligase family protein [Microbacterium sp. X-17]|uniref:O-antigen ligase family protein n=1 Tax=Microbacterium sp. X-17 TaxID=3144404 RepID=UPI0031F4CB65
MAVHTQHPAAAPPAPPPREKTSHLLLRAWCAFVVFAALLGAGWTTFLTPVGAAVLYGAAGVVSIVLWMTLRPRIDPQRLPWIALAFLAWNAISIAWAADAPDAAWAWGALALTTVQALFVASVLTWSEIVRAFASALQWLVALSLLWELAAAIWGGGPLFSLAPLHGIVEDPSRLGALALLAVVVFAIRLAARRRGRGLLIGWIVVAAFLFLRAESVIAYVSAGAVAVVLATILLMRTVSRPGGRTRYYVAYVVVGVLGALALLLWRDALGLHDLPGSSVWVAVFAATGVVGVVVFAAAYVSFVWRAWFFAVDRPRWDLRADRPYTSLTLLPSLAGTILLVQGLADASPLLPWGWLLLVLLGFKLGQAPLVGVGPGEQRAAIEAGERPDPA